MEQPRMWREILFLLVPLLTMVGFTLLAGCGNQKKDPYADLRYSKEDFQTLLEEDRKISKLAASEKKL